MRCSLVAHLCMNDLLCVWSFDPLSNNILTLMSIPATAYRFPHDLFTSINDIEKKNLKNKHKDFFPFDLFSVYFFLFSSLTNSIINCILKWYFTFRSKRTDIIHLKRIFMFIYVSQMANEIIQYFIGKIYNEIREADCLQMPFQINYMSLLHMKLINGT